MSGYAFRGIVDEWVFGLAMIFGAGFICGMLALPVIHFVAHHISIH